MLDIEDDLSDQGVEGQVTRELECPLTDNEVRERGEAMSQAEREVDALKLKRKNLNARIRGLLDRMTELSIAIEARKETREIVCNWVPDFKRKVYTLHRADTREVIQERAMGPADLQTALDLPLVAANNNGHHQVAVIDMSATPTVPARRKRAPAAKRGKH